MPQDSAWVLFLKTFGEIWMSQDPIQSLAAAPSTGHISVGRGIPTENLTSTKKVQGPEIKWHLGFVHFSQESEGTERLL